MIDFLQLSDQSFNKYVDGLSSEAYREVFNRDPDFADRINGGTAWMERRDQKELESFVTSELNKKKDLLIRELNRGRGLSTASWVWLNCKNLKTVRLPAPDNPDQTPFSINAVRPAYEEFNSKRGPFTHEERGILITLAQQAAPFGQVLDLRDGKSWEAAYHIGIASDKIALTRTKPVVEKPKIDLELATKPTEDQKKYAYFNKPVVTWKGTRYTQAQIDRMGSDEYKALVGQTGFDGGKIARDMKQILTHVPMGVK